MYFGDVNGHSDIQIRINLIVPLKHVCTHTERGTLGIKRTDKAIYRVGHFAPKNMFCTHTGIKKTSVRRTAS